MGNSLLRENRYFRCWDHHITEGCFCLPWKKLHIFKARQDFPKESEGTSSATNQQDNADQSSAEELCYALINHRVLRRRPSGNSAEGYYENVFPQAERPRELWRGTETDYSLLHVPSTPRHPPAPENEYEFLPTRTSSHSLE
ncbi:germinal center-associated signaling and motility protein [Phyllostomus hastatus]|uniref:germinal center-associated signaling and motility protein n=1 Tax=Phyllostomus hastatus TaxID=9423 RepID=UPI001E683A6B|nr:germinal center-associated signaling and motility protein [Phyllostomus hastatus]